MQQFTYVKLEHPSWEINTDLKIDWLIGNVSNLNIGYIPSVLQNGSKPFPSSDEIKGFSDKLFATQRNKNTRTDIKFVGGEFALHSDFLDIIQYLKINGSKSNISSNGTHSIEFWKEVKYYLSSVNLNYHHGYVCQNHFYNVIEELYNDLTLNVDLHVIPSNFDEVENFQQKLIDRFPYCYSQKKIQYYDINRNPLNYSEDQLTKLQHEKKEFNLYQKNGKIEKITRNELILKKNYFNKWWCRSGIDQIVIDFNGNIFNGWCMVKKIGNINDSTISLPLEPIMCNRERCYNGFDIMAMKSINKDD